MEKIQFDTSAAADMKKRIYYARTYRHLAFQMTRFLIFLLAFILPLSVLLLFCYDELTLLMSRIAMWFLDKVGLAAQGLRTKAFIPGLGPVWYPGAASVLPEQPAVLRNIGWTLAALAVLTMGPWKGKPLPIYLLISVVIHLMSCVFFLLGPEAFPYTAADYAELYMVQEVGIWITFLVLIGLVEGTLGRGCLLSRILAVLGVLSYSFLFGTLRLCLFLWALQRFSLLYLPVMYFALGPFFDFLYFVMIYSLSAGRMIKRNEGPDRSQWRWA